MGKPSSVGICSKSDYTDKIYMRKICDYSKTSITNYGNGLYFDSIGALTCLHCINDNSIIKTDGKISNLHCYSEECDLAFVKFNTSKQNYESLECFDDTIAKGKIKMIINSKTFVEGYIKDIRFEKLISFTSPALPYYIVETDNFENLLSGSIVLDNNDNFIGLVNNVNTETNEIKIIPNITINRFINEIKSTGYFNGLCGLVGRFVSCDYENEEGTVNYGVIIEDMYGVNYNFTSDKNYNLIKNGDIIIKTGEKKIRKNGMIKYKKIEMPFDTYISLTYLTKMPIPLTILRKKDDEYEQKNILVGTRQISTMKYIPIKSHNNFINIGGLILIELAEDVIDFYRKHNIRFCGYEPFYSITPFRNLYERVIVLIDINRKQIDQDILDQMDSYGLPFKLKDKNDYYIPILIKINKKKATNLEDLSQNRTQKKTLVFNVDKKIKIIIENEKIINLV